jgi:hypothetical protein
MRLVKLVHEFPGASLAPPSSVRLDLDAGRPSVAVRQGEAAPKRNAPGRPLGSRPSLQGPPGWWTARATAGEVKPGFTKEEILRKPETDPRVPGGTFERLGSLLGSLLLTS